MRTGSKHTRETREKMSASQKGLQAGPKHPMFGKHWSQEHKNRLRAANIGKRRSLETRRRMGRRGPLHYRWKGGSSRLNHAIRFQPEYKRWREDVFVRDDYTCRNCFQRGGSLEADHIEMLSDILDKNCVKTVVEALNCSEIWDIGNGQTLCEACHAIKTKKDRRKPIKVVS